MTTVVALTQGAELFFGNPADARAVKALWDTKLEDAPPHLDHEDAQRFARSWLVAQAAKVDVFCFVQEVWQQVWHRPGLLTLSLDEAASVADLHDDPLISWVTEGDDAGDRCGYGVVRLANGALVECAVCFSDSGNLSLWAWTDTQAPRAIAGWSDREGDGYLYTDQVATISERGIDISEARQRAESYLAACGGRNEKPSPAKARQRR